MESALLSRLGEGPEPVALLFGQSVTAISTLMGVICAGKYYCALAPDDPVKRSKSILANLKTRLLITDPSFYRIASQIVPDKCIALTLEELLADKISRNPPKQHLDHESLIAVYHTSGSTGIPKSIPRKHGMVLHRAWLDYNDMGIGADDRVAMFRSFMFSGSAGDIFSTLLNGAALCFYDVKKLGMASLPEYLKSEGITIFHPPIELLRYFLNDLGKNDFFPEIRLLVLSGDVLYKKDIEQIRQHFSKDVHIIHQMAASETGILARLVITADTVLDSEVVPAGYPVPGKEVLIVDENGKRLESGQEGEIAVSTRWITVNEGSPAGAGADPFSPGPDDSSQKVYLTGDLGRMRKDGLLEFIGRKDFQVKIRGYRINTAAIISKLIELDGIKRAVVTARQKTSGEKRLVAYLVVAPGVKATPENLRARLAASLPDYMLPSAFVFMDKIPITANGKIDYVGLPDPDWSHPEIESEAVLPRDDVERRLAGLWQEVLGVERVGIHEDFFDLGGHSLTGASLCSQIEKQFGIKLSPATLVENNTVERLAFLLRQPSLPAQVIIPIQTGGDKPPLFLAPGNYGDTLYFRPLASHLGADQPVFGLQVTDLERVLPPLADLETMAAYYIQKMRTFQATGPYFLAGHSFGGRLAFAIAQLLVQSGERVNLLVLMDTFAPGQHPKATFPERIRLHADNLRALPIGAWPGYFRQRVNNIIVRLSEFHSLRPIIARFRLIPPDTSSKNRIAARGYTYRRYPGKLIFFRVKDRPAYVHTNLTAGWQEYAADVEIHDVPGTHATLLNEPHVSTLAEDLKKCLQKARATQE